MIFAEITKRNYMSVSVTLKSYFYEVLIPSSQKNTSSPIEDILHHVSISFMKKLALYKCFNPRTHTRCDKIDTLNVELDKALVRMGLDEDNERSDAWDLLAAQSLASPYPYFFEAISWDYKGKDAKARECYINAMINPAFPSAAWDFTYWQDLSSAELKAISKRLLPKEEEYRKYFKLSTYSCPRHCLNFDDDYLTAKALDTLTVLPSATGAALMMYEAAVQANPFNARNFAGAALLSVQNGDSVKAARYLNEGLLIDADNEGLRILLKTWKGGKL